MRSPCFQRAEHSFSFAAKKVKMDFAFSCRQAASETESSMGDLAFKNGLETLDAQWSGRAQTH